MAENQFSAKHWVQLRRRVLNDLTSPVRKEHAI